MRASVCVVTLFFSFVTKHLHVVMSWNVWCAFIMRMLAIGLCTRIARLMCARVCVCVRVARALNYLFCACVLVARLFFLCSLHIIMRAQHTHTYSTHYTHNHNMLKSKYKRLVFRTRKKDSGSERVIFYFYGWNSSVFGPRICFEFWLIPNVRVWW